ncbi:hypothetical protein RFI_05553, partial [Reticulomyxa filosa]
NANKKLELETSIEQLENIEQVENKQQLEENINEGNTTNQIKRKSVQKEIEKTEIGEIKSGINLQGYCTNENCFISKEKLPVWINIGFDNISFISDKTSFCCPDCKKMTIASIMKVMFYNCEYSICTNGGDSISVKDNHYQRLYSIKSGISYDLNAQKIRQHAISIEDLKERIEKAMNSIEINNLVTELQKYSITIIKQLNIKEDNEILIEKIQKNYNGDFNKVFDIGRFILLCDNLTKLQTAIAIMKKAEQFNLIISEDKDFFEKQSKTHYRFHNIKLYIQKYDVYIEIQTTLKKFTTLEGYTIIENPKLIDIFYELIKGWKPNNSSKEEELKRASDDILIKMNDIIYEWIDEKEIKRIASYYKSNLEIGILKSPKLKNITEEQINNNIVLKLIKFIYDQLCKFTPIKIKGQAIYVILYEYYKKYIIGETNPASCIDVSLILQESRKLELEEDIIISQAIETYIPLQANNYPYNDNIDRKKNNAYDCYEHIINFLEESKNDYQQKKVMIIQGNSGSGKSLFCRYLEEILWKTYNTTKYIPIYISLPKYYNHFNEQGLISQALQMKQINKEMLDIIRENISFIFILDGFDEIFDSYNNNNNNNDKEKYFYNRFNLDQWNSKIIITCRNNILNNDDVKQVLIGKNLSTSIIYLWPFSNNQIHDYIEKFVKMKEKNKINTKEDWTSQTYEKTLKNYPNLNKMIEEPFFLKLLLTVLPSLMKQQPLRTKILKTQVYETFNEQWIDIHIQNICNKLSELNIQTNFKKIKLSFQKYCQDLAYDIYEKEEIYCTLDPKIEIENKSIDEKIEIKMNEIDNISILKIKDNWEKYFNGDSIAKYVLRRIGDNKYQFLHKSCQEYYAAQKI